MYMTNFRRFIVLMGLTLTLLVGSFASPAFAQPKLAQIGDVAEVPPVTAPTPVEPNDFTLSGIDTTIHYSTTSLRGLPQFNYNGRQFSGNEIASLDTAIGKLVTVLIEPDSDGGREVLLTLLLPTINLPSSIESPIQTTAILTTKRTVTRGGPRTLEGQIETYKTLSLTGTARRVDS